MELSRLETALQNLQGNNYTDDDLNVIRQGFVKGEIFIGGNVVNSVIIVGNGNSVQLTIEALELLDPAHNFSALHQLPQAPIDFVGREEELGSIQANIDESKGAAISGLTGMGGIGKTTLGLVIAHTLATKYTDAQFFIDLKGTTEKPLQPIDLLKHVVQNFKPKANLKNATESELVGQYQSLLSNKKAVLFLDNARNASQIAPLIPPPSCCMIITSRWQFVVPGLQALRLDVLNEQHAIQFLITICPRLHKEDAGQIASLCGYLPIALRLAASFLQAHQDWSPREYIAELSKRDKRIKLLDRDEENTNLQTIFSLSYQMLSTRERGFWSRLAVFPAPFDRSAAASVWELDDEKTHNLSSKLCQYSLLKYDSVSGRYRLHDLLRDFASTKLTPSKKKLSRLNYFRHYQNVWRAAEELYAKGGDDLTRGLLQFDTESTHLMSAYKWALENAEMDPEISKILTEIPGRLALIPLRLRPKERIKWFQAALTAGETLDDFPRRSHLLGNIGAAYADLGEHRDAIAFYTQALEAAREIGDRSREGYLLGNMGAAHTDIGETSKAIELLEQALAIARETGELHHEGDCLNNLAVAYAARGDTRKSIEYLEQALKIVQQTRNREREGEWSGNLGASYLNLGESRKALIHLEKSLKIAQEIRDRRHEGFWLGTMGMALTNLGEFHKALNHLEQALKIARELGDRWLEHNWLGNFGVAYCAMGEPRKALEYLDPALAITREISDRQSEGDWLGNVGVCYAHLGDTHKAEHDLSEALAIALEVDAKWQEAQWHDQLGELCIQMNDTLRAQEHLDRALLISRTSEIREIEGRSLFNLARLSELNGNAGLALQYAQPARLIFETMEFRLLKEVKQFIERLDQ
jgi:tetratricopeptide (TPR) repeat protein